MSAYQTQFQTVEIRLPNHTAYGVEYAPVAPAPGNIKVKNNHSVTTWSKHHIEEVLSNGTSKIWRPKPTLAEMVTRPKGRFVQFFSDGSVLMKDGQDSFWGPTEKGTPVLGIIVHSHICLDGHEVFNDESDCFCETRIPLEDQRYSFWS